MFWVFIMISSTMRCLQVSMDGWRSIERIYANYYGFFFSVRIKEGQRLEE